MTPRTIWKYPVKPGAFELTMPLHAQILCVQEQQGEPHLWALVSPDASRTETRRFRSYGTGHDIDGMGTGYYIGTFQLADGALVFHLFEVVS